MTTRRLIIKGAASMATPLIFPHFANAADPYPNKLITIVVPQAPGGANDVIGRALAQKLAVALGVPVVAENRQGAGGNVGTAYVARQPKDGYTLLLNAQSVQTINPFLYRKVPFDPVKDFDPVMVVGVAPYMLAANNQLPVKNLQELIALAKAQPGKLNFASSGNGTVNHMLGEMLKTAASIDIVHVPYRGAAGAATDTISGQAQFTFGSFPGLMPFVKSGQLKALGTCTEKRTQLAPDLPTMAETIPGLFANAWYGLFVPAGTPKDIINKLHSQIVKLLENPEIKTQLLGLGVEPFTTTPDQLASLLKEDLMRWSKIVKDSGAQID